MKYYDKKCQRCNEKYAGTASSKYCVICKDVIRQAQIANNSKKKKPK